MKRKKKGLTNEERLSLIAAAKEGDNEAFLAYLKANKGLINYIIGKYTKGLSQYDVCDLRQEALLGLRAGIDKFKIQKNATSGKPEGYIFSWVRAYVTRYVKTSTRLKGPWTELVPIHSVADDDAFWTISGENKIMDRRRTPDQHYDQIDVVTKINQFVKTLEDRKRVIVTDRLLADSPRSLRDIGEQFGISHERVRQIEIELRATLTEFAKEHNLINV